MTHQGPPEFPSSKPKKNRNKGVRPSRRDSASKPGAPQGPQLPAEHPDSLKDAPSTEEMALRYARALQAEKASADVLLIPISPYLEAPSLEAVDPASITREQVIAGMKVLIPGSSQLNLGDEFKLLWGSRVYPAQTVNEENINQPIIGTEWAVHTPEAHLPQGNVKVCYDVYRNGQRIGTSAILHANVPNCYTSSEKQRKRRRSIRRKQQRRAPL